MPTLDWSAGMPTRRRAELLLYQLSCRNAHVSLKDGKPHLRCAKDNPKISRAEALSLVKLVRADVIELLAEKAVRP